MNLETEITKSKEDMLISGLLLILLVCLQISVTIYSYYANIFYAVYIYWCFKFGKGLITFLKLKKQENENKIR